MKKLMLVLIVLAVAVGTLFAFDNNQKIYGTDCDEYRFMTYLYVDQGHALPSTTGPWSEAELSAMLAKIDPSKLDDAMKAIYDKLDETLNGQETMPGLAKGIKTGFTFDLNLELYYHTNTDTDTFRDAYSGTKVFKEYPFQGVSNWQYDELKQKPFFGLRWDTYVGELFYSHFEFELRNSFHSGKDSYATELGYTNFGSNILFLQSFKMDLGLFDGNVPFRAFVSMGTDYWTLQLGRDRISWGAGETGNLSVSDNLLYHNMVRFTAFSDNYKYTFLASFFPHTQSYYEGAHWDGYDQGQGGLQNGVMMYMAHRVEGRLLNDTLNLGITEAIMYKQPNGVLDLRYFNPVMFYHNNYIPDISNSTLVFEADYSPIRHLNIYAQYIIDEIAFPGLETAASPTAKSTPSGNGFIFGLKTSFGLKGGVFHANAEVAKTDPYLYLRSAGAENNYNLNYVVSIRQWSSSTTCVSFDDEFLGYTYGPDAIVFNAKAGYDLNKLKVEGSIFYMLHGTHDAWTTWTRTGGEGEDAWAKKSSTPTTEHETVNNKYDDAKATRDSVSKTFIIGVNASYQFTQSLSAFAQADFISIVNWNNVSTNPVQKDFQVALGGSWKF